MDGESCQFDLDECFNRAIDILRSGGVVVYPTDTVYGVGGDPFDVNVVNRVTHLKGRVGKPYPILISGKRHALRLFMVNDILEKLMDRFWPGGLTIVARARYGIPGNFFLDKIGFRMPGHDRLLRLIEEVGGYIIGTSANYSGMPPATSIEMAKAYFGGSVDLYLDGGVSKPFSSTVVEVEGDKVIIRRLGVLDREAIHDFCSEVGCSVYEEV